MVFVFGSVYVMDYIYRLAYVEPALHPWVEAYLIVRDKLLDVVLQSVASILLKIFVSMLIMDIGFKVSFLLSLCLVLVSGQCWSHKMG